MIAHSLPRELLDRPVADAPDAEETVAMLSGGAVRLTLHRDMADLHRLWRDFEQTAICTHAQTHAWLATWQRVVAAARGIDAAIIIGCDESGNVLFIWPFEIFWLHGLRTLRWMGQEQANYNMGLYRRNAMAAITGDDMRRLLTASRRLIGGVSQVCLLNQPHVWEGQANPFATLPHRPSPSSGHVVTLSSDFDALFAARFGKSSRESLRRKERKLRQAGPLELAWAASPEERMVLFDTFFRQKGRWFAENGISDMFADPHIRAFYQAMAAQDGPEADPLQIAALRIGDTVSAIIVGVLFRDRYTVLQSSITAGELKRWSPGMILMTQQIEQMARRGLRHYDIGVGEAQHKAEWADQEVALFDSFIGFDAAGQAVAALLAARSSLKRTIKTSPHLWALARRLRRSLRRRTADGEPSG